MKRLLRPSRLLFLFPLFLLCLPAFSPVGEPRNGIAVGFSGGVVLNSVGFDPTIKQQMHIGPTLGVVARFTSEKYFSTYCALQVELNYAQLGWKENVLDAQ